MQPAKRSNFSSGPPAGDAASFSAPPSRAGATISSGPVRNTGVVRDIGSIIDIKPVRKIHGGGDDSYFDEIEEIATQSGAVKRKEPEQSVEEFDDPLDAFMNEIEVIVSENATKQSSGEKGQLQEQEDHIESFAKHMKAKKAAESKPTSHVLPPLKYNTDGSVITSGTGSVKGAGVGISAEEDYDSDEEVYSTAAALDAGENANDPRDKRNGPMEQLAPLDHAQMKYEEIKKCFYDEDPEIFCMSPAEVAAYRKELDLKTEGREVPHPIREWAHCGFDKILTKELEKHKYLNPTPIQCQALPVALSGRDLIGVAQTGSGKTAAYVLPMIVHLMAQREVEKGEGPIGLTVAPTRELCQQIYLESKKFGRGYGIRVCVVYGGIGKNDQRMELLKGCEILVGTPGRIIDMIKGKATKMNRVTFVVLDEADRMFSMGFEPQVKSILGQINPNKQFLLFSATFKKKVEELAGKYLVNPVTIKIGTVGEANEMVTQHIIMLDASKKWGWLMEQVPPMMKEGGVLIFVSTRAACEELSSNLITHARWNVAALHGDKDQIDRDNIFRKFKKQEIDILIATDVAARGLDVKHVKNVICFDVAKDKDMHTHRIGRTGRGGETGDAWILFSPQDKPQAATFIVHSLQEVGQVVPEALVKVANRDPAFKARKGRPGNKQIGGAGLGFDGHERTKGGTATWERGDIQNKNHVPPSALMQQFSVTEGNDNLAVTPSTQTHTPAQPQTQTAPRKKPPPPPPPKPLGEMYFLERNLPHNSHHFAQSYATPTSATGFSSARPEVAQEKEAITQAALAALNNPEIQRRIAATKAAAALNIPFDPTSFGGNPPPPPPPPAEPPRSRGKWDQQ